MKNLFLFLFAGLLVAPAQAQHFQIVDQTDFDNTVMVSAPIPGGGFYMAVQAGEPGLYYSDCLILRYDAAGNELWRVELPGWERDIAYDMLVLPDSSVLVCGAKEYCLLIPFGFLARIGADGNVLWQNPSLPFEFYPIHTMTVDDVGNVWVHILNYLHGIDVETGTHLATLEIPLLDFSEYTDIYFHPLYQRFYVVGNVGVHWVDPLTGNLQTVTYLQSSDGPFLEIIPLNDSIMMTHSENGEVVVFSADNTVNTIDWSSHGSEYVAINNDGRLAVYGLGKLLVYSPDFQLQQEFEPWLAGLTVNDMVWSNDRIVLAGDAANTLDPYFNNTALWAQSYDPDGNTFNSVQEVEMMEVINTQPPIATLLPLGSTPSQYSITQGAFDVRVRNLSFAVLDSLTIHTAYYGYDFLPTGCFARISHQSIDYTGLNLGVAQEVTLPIGLLETSYIYNTQINPWKVCFWAGNPNGQTDMLPENNLACLDVYPTVGTKEPEAIAFSLFPNPATDACTITWGENLQPETVQVYDAFGRLLLTETVDSHAGQHDLELGAWPSGVYTVLLDKAVRRLVKM